MLGHALLAEFATAVDERRLEAAEAEVEAGVAGHRHRHLEGLGVALARPASPAPARPGSRARAAAPTCRRPRRRRRRASARAPRGRRGRVTPASSVWPPLATRQRNGGSSGSGSRKLAATWPCRWSTGISGSRRGAAIALAVLTPTRRAPISPGPAVAATASISSSPTPASASAASTTGAVSSRWWREATSGTTPPKCAWAAACEEIRFERIRGPSSTAAQVSSQEVSIARINRAT